MTRVTASLAIALTMLAVVEAKAKFISTWKAPAAANVSYFGKKVVGLVVSNDLALRMSTEEALARELTGRGLQGVAAYRVIPGEEVKIPERAKAWFEQNGTAGVVVMRLVDISKEQTPSVMVWQNAPYYGSLWSYYPYAWGTTVVISPSRTDTRYVVETLVFDVAGNRLLWAGTSESVNPSDAQSLIKSIVDAAAEQMKKDGLIRKK